MSRIVTDYAISDKTLKIGPNLVKSDMSSTFYVSCAGCPQQTRDVIFFKSGAQTQIENEFGASHWVSTLGIGLVNLGIAIRPLITAPLSERYGRQPFYVGANVCFTAFSLGAALSPSITALLLFRFLSAFFGAAVFSNFGGTLADLFPVSERGPPVALSTLVLQGAPTIGPVPSSFMGEAVSWRWVLGLLAIWGGAILILVLLLPETEPGAIMKKLRKKNSDLGDSIEKNAGDENATPKIGLSRELMIPIVMLFHEPILFTTCIYHAFVYGLLFLLIEAYPYVYKTLYHYNAGKAGLVFLAPWLGNTLGVLIYFGFLKPRYERQQVLSALSNRALSPEHRLPGVLLSSIFVPIGLFWFAATASSHVHFIVPILSGIPIGMGMTLLQLSLAAYYIDLYPSRAASALAANLVFRNLVAAISPSVAVPMYTALGIRTATLVLAVISLAGVPAGLVLLAFGKRIRKRSHWAVQDANDESAGSNLAITESGVVSSAETAVVGGSDISVDKSVGSVEDTK